MEHNPLGDSRFGDPLFELAAVLLSEQTVDDILELTTALTKRSISACKVASITLTTGQKPFTSNSTDALAIELDEAQYEKGTGPCLHAGITGVPVNVLLDEDDRWPEFTEAALRHDIRSVLSTPLSVKDHVFGGLNIYSDHRAKFDDDDDREKAALMARQASIVLASAMAFAGAQSLNDQLRDALETRDLIGQAKGILMERQHVGADKAFDILRRSSQRANNKLREIALELVRRAERRGHKS